MFRTFFLFLNILSAILLAFTYLSPYINPLEHRKIPLIGLFYPALLLTNIGFIVGWFYFNQVKYSLLSILVILFGLQHLFSLISIPYLQESVAITKDAITVSTYNIKTFDDIAWKKNSFQPAAIKNLIREFKNSDYLCAQEVHYTSRKMLEKELKYPYSYGTKGTRIFSKQPFLKKGTLDFGETENSCIWVDISFNSKTVRLYNVHLESNHISPATKEIVKKEEFDIKGRIKLLRGMISQYLNRNRLRVQQTGKVLQHITNSPHPVIVCGDFNDAPLSYIYRRFTKQLNDGFLQQGRWSGVSFRGYIPLLRIDYIFADPTLEFQQYRTIRTIKYSDHYPVTAIIDVRN